jgi:hypothetical protein
MNNLNHHWLTDGLIDFEYKKYVLLAYFQHVKQNFGEKKLYPYLADLVFHYQNLVIVKENKKLLTEQFPSKLSNADIENLTLAYEKIVQDDGMMQEIEDIIQFSLPKFKDYLSEGRDIYEDIEHQLQISPIGISPLHPEEGYLLLSQHFTSDTLIYEYRMSIFTQADEKYRGIHLNYLETKPRTLANTYENMKTDLLKRFRDKPNPATYLIEAKTYAPLHETVLPIAKRILVKYISVSSTT